METPDHFRPLDRVQFTQDVWFGVEPYQYHALKGSTATVLKYWPLKPYYTILLDEPVHPSQSKVNCPDYVLKRAD